MPDEQPPFEWGEDQAEGAAPTSVDYVGPPGYTNEFHILNLWQAIWRLYNCNVTHRCLSADMVDGVHAATMRLTVAGGDAIDSPNLVEGSAIDITTSSSDITIAVDINELTSATVANGDEVAIADVDDSNALKKVTALSIAQLATGGDVSGPASSTDNAVARFDGTGGKTLQNSGVTINDSDVMGGVSEIQVDTVELGGAAGHTDTTLTRSSAGVVAVEGNVLVRGDLNLSDLENNATALANLGILRGIVTSDVTVASTTMANSTGLAVTVEGSTWYHFECYLIATAADHSAGSRSGFKFDFDGGTATVTSMEYSVVRMTTTGTAGENVQVENNTALATDVTGQAAGTTNRYKISGFIQVSAAGTIQARHAAATAFAGAASQDAVMHAGSWMRLTKVS